MYDELKDISYIFYINSNGGKLHTCNIYDKEEVDDNGYPRYRAQYENCLIALRNQKVTDKLYLNDRRNIQQSKKEILAA